MTAGPCISGRRARLGLAAAAALVALAGCVPEPAYIPHASYETGPSQLAFAVYFRQGQPDLAAGEVARVREVLQTLQLRPGDDISVRVGVTGRQALDDGRIAAAAAALTGTPARVRVVGTEPAPLGDGFADVGVIDVVRNGRIRVVCPTPAIDSWERDRLLVDPPVACSNALNIANMAARPADLVAPRSLRGSGGVVSAAAVDRYRADQVKAIANLDSMNGN